MPEFLNLILSKMPDSIEKRFYFFPVFSIWAGPVYGYNISVFQLLKLNGIDIMFSEKFCSTLIEAKIKVSGRGEQGPDRKIREAFISQTNH